MSQKKLVTKPKAAPKPVTSNGKKLNVRTALKAVPLPDPGKMGRLSDLCAPPNIRLGGENSSTFTSVVENKTPTQRALEECSEWYRELAKDDGFIRTVSTMIGLRRVYAVALRELNEQVDTAREAYAKKGLTMPVVVGDFAAQLAMYQASKPFDEHDVMQGMIEIVMPWMADVIDSHAAIDQKEDLDAKVHANETRKARPVPIGFKHTPAQDGLGLGRERTLVLVGWKNAVCYLLDLVSKAVLNTNDEQVYTVLRFMHNAPKPGEQHARLIRLGQATWKGFANSDRELDKLVFQTIAPMLGSPVDLVICDDMSAAHTLGPTFRPAAACAGDAHRRMRKWCDGMGSALLAAVPCQDRELPDFSGAEFEQLKTFTHLRPIQVLDGADFDKPDFYRLVVGTESSVFDVTKTTLDSYSTTLFVPDSGVLQ